MEVQLNADSEPVITVTIKGEIYNCPLTISMHNPIPFQKPDNFSWPERNSQGIQYMSLWQYRACLESTSDMIEDVTADINFIEVITHGTLSREEARQLFIEAPVRISICFGRTSTGAYCSKPFNYNDIAGRGVVNIYPYKSVIAATIKILQDKQASDREKFDAMHIFLDPENLTEEAFWALLELARERTGLGVDRPFRDFRPLTLRASALFFLSTAVAYTHPTDIEKGRLLIRLVRSDRFQKILQELESDPSWEVRQERLYFFGATTINTHPSLVAALAETFLPLIFSTLQAENDEFVLLEGLWSLEQFLEPRLSGSRSLFEVGEDLSNLAASTPYQSVREAALDLLEEYVSPPFRPYGGGVR